MPEPVTLAESFRTQFDAEVEKRFKAGFLNKVVERSAVASMLRNIIIGVLHDMNKLGVLPNVPTSSSFSGQTALQYYRSLATLIAISITDNGVVKFDSRVLSTHLFNTTKPYDDPTQGQTFYGKVVKNPMPPPGGITVTHPVPSPDKSFEENVAELAQAFADQLKTLPPASSSPAQLKEKPLAEEPRQLQFGRKLILDDE